MQKITIDDSGMSLLLDFVGGGKLRKIARMYFAIGMSSEEISKDLGYNIDLIEKDIEKITDIAKTRLHFRTCVQCGIEFYSGKTNAQLCESCREDNKKVALERMKEGNKKPPKAVAKKRNVKSLKTVLKQLDRYNKKHHTELSYGQYVALRGE